MTKIFEVENLSFGWSDSNALTAPVSLSVEPCEALVVFGDNGVGKSSFCEAIFGSADVWSKGSVFFDNRKIPNLAALTNQETVRLKQSRPIFPGISVRDLARACCLERNNRQFLLRVTSLLNYFPKLEEFWEIDTRKLSVGQLAMSVAGTSLINQPRLLVWDEPFAGLSAESKSAISQGLTQYLKINDAGAILIDHTATLSGDDRDISVNYAQLLKPNPSIM